ncbi:MULTISPECIES: serine hydrolase domain-containing protein [unclassified Streptomyces]|uniref:serine hydrolase domain-containing protein n=1 Tax=unclassified Streptomyces TaxID=2593676 RepID=UPI002DD80F71|nr:MULTISPECIES: serine hydrolase domain-containing protein [unclassified Streptomyces]WSA94327.1 beta-lactamase family protein [Streptomyces sp. NBC_01795]WSB78745.1 beta-lactamase family protein [Streptomyces sp. NBC_01775]WSS13051.1 beta-lactamase family protein [Streptomyces sp. NBC_01186]WSS41835.1 beta-lactamase family protein [Streptomyces sp. NBC_01187]
MRARIRGVAAVLVLGITAGPVGAGVAVAEEGPRHPAVAEHQEGPDRGALKKALRGVPDEKTTAALVRVGGIGHWRRSAGVHDLRTQRPALAEARFRAGSTTKVVTSALVLRLASEGLIDLDGTVQHYLPGLLTDEFDPITVRQLLTFTSGLQPGSTLGPENGEGYENRFKTLTPEAVVAASVAKGPYKGEGEGPGKKQRYANIDYTVLGMLVEKVTDDSYEHQAEVKVLRPAGMENTSFPGGPDPRIHGPHNRGYQKLKDGRLVDATEWNMSDRWAAGDMISTTEDLEKLLFTLFKGKIVPQPLLEREMFTLPDAEGAQFSAGLQRYDAGGGRIVWAKTGARPGYNTLIAATRNLSRTLVYSLNSTEAKATETNPVGERLVEATFSPSADSDR